MPAPPSPALTAALDRLDRVTSPGVRPGLTRMRALLSALGNPHADLPTVLVAGTNGKGSTAHLLASITTTAHYRTGLYTSPHLETPEETLRVDGEPIAPDDLAALLHRVLDTIETAAETLGDPPTRFETLTAAALLHLAERRVDLAVLEVGLGGRLDAVNAAEPILSIVTTVALDHREHLGDTPAEIAREKAGVFRAGVPAVIGAAIGAVIGQVVGEARGALVAAAEEIGARPVLVARRIEAEAVQRFRPFSDDPDAGGAPGPRQRIWLRHVAPHEVGAEAEADPDAPPAPGRSPDRSELEVYELALAGRHQVNNLATAVVAAEELRELGWEKLTRSAMRRGARACRLAGRLEEVAIPDRAALPGGGRVLLDAAHNAAGAAALALAIRDLGEPADLVFGVLSDKDAAGMLEALAPHATRVTLTTPPGERGRKAETLRELVEEDALAGGPRKPGRPKQGEAPGERVDVIDDPGRAIESALKKADGQIVVVAGSLALVGAIRTALRKRYGTPAE
jgi:dihydrofolate synthase / folylpolyglutamate synthase